ncbi:alpha/beta fold hydrolase [Streptomyces tsukubensis]|uniref:Alpha/beta hydrolase n=1 Tax=Streptomyces tsukubensis (strain DSM 42081 / NBRC 108919 / NRRL 18488 / 9993) TaxID=1114943 RepID=A0A7G3UG44_STRT9|nr:alpha/beta fold hydrolase [Streptomyces tsukubensis]AZK94526.1 alpha/beta hydrolase [Streptomyces tsukubensis]QKM69383.1 alpha/beta hydrolase [Streptomyces tsukubensis NRRL18488]TAI42685.1 alpha/beta fold hydrolase [Streptomyces tsukubensis]
MSRNRNHSAPDPARDPRITTAESADGTALHIEIHGPGDAPALVLSHGWTCSTRFWDAQIRALSADFRVVVYDQRGHGRTPMGRVSTGVLADDLEAVLRTVLAPGEQAVVAGHSMGAMTIVAAAGRPALIEHAAALLLCSTAASHLVEECTVLPGRRGGPRTRATRAVLRSPLPLGPVTPLGLPVLRRVALSPAATRAQVAACARIVHACPRIPRAAWAQVLETLDLTESVRVLDLPAVVLVGSADRLTPPVHSHRLAANLPDCRGLVVLDGAGHMTPVERPDDVTAQLRSLVAQFLGPGHPESPAPAATLRREEAPVGDAGEKESTA